MAASKAIPMRERILMTKVCSWPIVVGFRIDGRKISVSLATFEFKASDAGAKLIMTEQGAFLDGYDVNGEP
ncbi:hypothetical protein J7E70_29820 [Variovorax paradoxus]|nr:hypothetical protein [Variovorax paradoxus]